MKKSEFLLLADKFRNGLLTEEEEALFHAHCDWLEGQVTAWNATEMDEEATVKRRIFENITSEIHATNQKTTVFRINWRLLVAAATVSLALFAGFLFKNELYNRFFPVKMLAVETQPGKSVRTKLPDGTSVWLNAESRITYPEQFRDSTRTVTLTGEAYFDVAHNAEQPFLIKSNGLVTRVLGTRFLVKSYAEDAVEKITVFSGKVRVNRNQSPGVESPGVESPAAGSPAADNVVLLPKQQLVASRISGDMSVSEGADSLSAMSWTSGKLMYRNVALAEVIDDLERRFNVKIGSEKHLETCLIHADVMPGDSLQDVLDLLAVSLNGKAEKLDETTYRLRGKGCK